MSAAHRRILGAVSITALVLIAAGAFPASAADPIAIDQEQVLWGEEGASVELATVRVEPAQVGSSCTMRVRSENQFSVHPGNDLVITTGEDTAVIADVEAEPDGDRNLEAPVVLGPTITVALRFGPDQLSSMGFHVEVDCGDTGPVVLDETIDREPTEVDVTPPSIPGPCPTEQEALTTASEGCPEPGAETEAEPEPLVVVVEETDQGTEAAGPEVLGVQIERLPETPAAAAVAAAPAYTG